MTRCSGCGGHQTLFPVLECPTRPTLWKVARQFGSFMSLTHLIVLAVQLSFWLMANTRACFRRRRSNLRLRFGRRSCLLEFGFWTLGFKFGPKLRHHTNNVPPVAPSFSFPETQRRLMAAKEG